MGMEEQTGKHYLSIPVTNRLVDYEEYYEIDNAEFDKYKDDPDAAAEFVQQCRNRERDDRIMIKPGKDRGVAK